MPETGPPSDDTRAQLIHAALHLFAQQGYAATTTRAIAAQAGANIGLIAYHFGGKPQLREACARAVVDRVGHVLGAALPARPDTPDAAQALLEGAIRAVLSFMLREAEAADIAGFVLRELTEEGAVLDILYDGLFAPRHRELCAIWGIATGRDPESEAVRIAVFAMMGQVLYFRLGRPVVLRRMGWDGVDAARAEQIAEQVIGNLRVALERDRI